MRAGGLALLRLQVRSLLLLGAQFRLRDSCMYVEEVSTVRTASGYVEIGVVTEDVS